MYSNKLEFLLHFGLVRIKLIKNLLQIIVLLISALSYLLFGGMLTLVSFNEGQFILGPLCLSVHCYLDAE